MLKKILVLACIVFVVFATNVFSQGEEKKSRLPENKYGLGVNVGTSNFGIVGAYAINQDFHFGAQFGFYLSGIGEENAEVATYLQLAPYVKYFFLEGTSTFKPYIQGAFNVTSAKVKYSDYTGETKYTQKSMYYLSGSIGAEWFPYSSVGIYGGIQALEFNVDPISLTIGVGTTYLGIEWFFN